MTDETIEQIKLWKLKSYSYKKNVLEPLSMFLNISIEEVEELLARNLDMARIESSHSSAEQAKLFRMEKQVEVDLGLDYFLNLELLTENIINSIREDVMNNLEKSGKLDFDIKSNDYKKLIDEAREKILELLKENY
jgi:energy-converting hydrogenase A subunit M